MFELKKAIEEVLRTKQKVTYMTSTKNKIIHQVVNQEALKHLEEVYEAVKDRL